MAKNPQLLVAQIAFSLPRQEENVIQRENLELEAKEAILAEIDKTGETIALFEKNSKGEVPIASIVKLMTALVVFDMKGTYSPSQLIEITKAAVSQEGASKFGDLRIGESLSVENLLNIMLIESSNDAAYALTYPIGEKAFVDLMNLYAEKLGMENTHFINVNGYEPDDPEGPVNYSTAEDLVKLTKYILENYPQIFEITNKQSYEVLSPDGSLHHFIPENTNKLLAEIPNVIGGKTGFTYRAEECLLLVYKEKDNYFISVVLGSKDRFGETKKLIEWNKKYE
jgi:D-alanyl-D-alanine carboxypeptidase (penicillin-binding protein 5/6)